MIFEHLPWRLQTLVGRILTPHAWSLSQAGQDAWVFGEAFNEMRMGFFVDIGAHDGVTISNTYLLERRYGWAGLCIEANPVTFELLRQSRRATCLNVCLDREPGEVEFATRGVLGGIIGDRLDNKASPVAEQTIRLQTTTLQAVLKEHRAPNVVDYLSIDVEGAEERVLDSFDYSAYQFRCMTVERPSVRLRKIVEGQGYVLIKEIPGLDCFFVHRDFLDAYKANLFAFYQKRFLFGRWS